METKDIKACKDCKWILTTKFLFMKFYKCTNVDEVSWKKSPPWKVDNINGVVSLGSIGTYKDCDSARDSSVLCGREARFFEAA